VNSNSPKGVQKAVTLRLLARQGNLVVRRVEVKHREYLGIMKVGESVLDSRHRKCVEHYLFVYQTVVHDHSQSTVRFRHKKTRTGVLGVTLPNHSFVDSSRFTR
jgi:hypothetical protein